MRTPRLGRRVVRVGVATVALAVLVVELVVYASLARALDRSIDDALALRSDVVRQVAAREPGVEELAEDLAALGIPAQVVGPDASASARPAVVRNRPGEELVLGSDASQVSSTDVPLGDGRVVEVFVSRAGAIATLQRLLLVEAVAGSLAVVVASLLLRRGTRTALAPLDEMAAAAHGTAEGERGRRLEPDDPTSELGRLASSYDQMLDQLESAIDQATEAEERSRRFLGDAAHQLRTPLASLRAGVELLLIDPDPRGRDEHLSRLLRETGRANRLLNSLLMLARLDAGAPVDLVPIDLAVVCREEVERAASLAPHLDVAFEDLRSAPTPVPADAASVAEAIANLMDNARRHARSEVRLRLSSDGDGVVVDVLDDGGGVPEESRDAVFERFAVLDGRGGSGLGLPIARAIARGHGGDLTCDADGFRLTLSGPSGGPSPPG